MIDPFRRELPMKSVIMAVFVAVTAVPVTLIATFLLLPVWVWAERELGIEAVGHSGPAEWCFFAISGLMLLVVALVVAIERRSGPR